MIYQDTLGQKVLKKLEETLGDSLFKHYFYGDNIFIPQTQLPCVIVDKISSDVDQGATGTDEREQNYVVKILINKKDEYGKDPEESPGQTFLENIAEGLDPTTGEYSDESVVGVLRKNLTLDDVLINQNVRIVYGIRARPEETITLEAHVFFGGEELLTVTDRQ